MVIGVNKHGSVLEMCWHPGRSYRYASGW